MHSKLTKHKSTLLSIILPVLFLFFGIVLGISFGPYFLRSIDPEYAYLFNGLTVARLRFELGHIDHPGTPLQILLAFSIWVVQIFKHDQGLVNNVISNPELYLKVTYYIILSINSIGLFLLGKIISRSLGIFPALFLQCVPLISVQYFAYIMRIRPESLQLFCVTILMLLLIIYIYKEKFKLSTKNLNALFAATVSFTIALKLNTAPLALIPLILIEGRKNKLRYIAYTIVLIVIFSFPILVRHKQFFQWISDLFMHSGQYGKGEKNIMDFKSVWPNFIILFANYKLFFIVQTCILTTLPFFHFYRKRIPGKNIRLLTATLIASLIQIFIVLKHFGIQYLVPFNLFSLFQIWLLIEITSHLFGIHSRNVSNLLYLPGIIIILMVQTPELIKVIEKHKKNRDKNFADLTCMMELRNDAPLLLYDEGYGNVFVEHALYFGCSWSGRYRNEYKKNLQKKYPNTYQYDRWDDNFVFWSDTIKHEKFKSHISKETYLFLGQNVSSVREAVLNEINEMAAPDSATLELLCRNDKTIAALYRINVYNAPSDTLQSIPDK
ncbi:MAG: hypothetical protein PVF73_13500 [Bacteroidales bacterium]|jgi:hypothetical protein